MTSMLNIIRTISSAIALLLCISTTARAQTVTFNCPDLYNASKRSIEPLTQGFDGWFFRKNDLKTDFSLSPQTALYFKRLNDALKSRDIQLVMVPLLSRAMLAEEMVNKNAPWQELYDINVASKSYGDFINQLTSNGLLTANLYKSYKENADSNTYNYGFKRDIHWKPKGAEIFAKSISPLITSLKGYEKQPQIDVDLVPQSEIGRFGTIMEELQRLCTSSISAESFTISERKQAITKNADALFGGGNTVTPIALVGSSFSAQDVFAFPAYMEKFTKLEVANFAIPAGGMFTSLISHLSTPYFHENKPFVLLWETQTIYNYNEGTEQQFRQAIPAVYGICTGNNLIAENKVSVAGEPSYRLLGNLANRNISGTDYYIYIHADNLGFNKFSLQFEYDDQDGEWFPVDRTSRYNHKGHYYIELSDKISSNLSHITLEDVVSSSANLSVKLCKKPATKSN